MRTKAVSLVERKFYRVRDVAKMLDCSEQKVLDMIANKSLPAQKVGREWRIAIEVFDRLFPSSR